MSVIHVHLLIINMCLLFISIKRIVCCCFFCMLYYELNFIPSVLVLSPAEINNFVNVSINDFIPSGHKDTFVQFDEYGILKQVWKKLLFKISLL